MPKFMYCNNYALEDNSKTLTSHLLVVYKYQQQHGFELT